MKTLQDFHLLLGFVVFMLLTTASRGQTCEAPSSAQCFRRKADDSSYRCEWHLNTTDSPVKYYLFYDCPGCNRTNFANTTDRTWLEIIEENLIQYQKIDIWVEAGWNTNCRSPRWSAVLNDVVKYNAPENIALSWSKTNLTLCWTAVENFPAKAEVLFRRMIIANGTESWKHWMANTTSETSQYKLTVANLLNNTAYEVRIRHASGRARVPLLSDWSPLVIVPAELEKKPEVTVTKKLVNGTRSVTLTWKPAPHAAAVSNVTYTVDLKFHGGCLCKDKEHETQRNSLIVDVPYTAGNISLKAKNAAGVSPSVIVHIPAESSPDLRACENISLDEKYQRRTCLHLYELQDGDSRPKKVIHLTARTDIHKTVKKFTRYLYFKHRCQDGKPQNVNMCLFYLKEGVPVSEPLDLSPLGETHNSVNLSWKAIPLEKLQGFLTCYNLCVRKVNSLENSQVCHHIAESRINYRLKNLTPGAKYNITLAGATREGEGPKATITINTLPENHQEINLPLILSLLFVIILIFPIGTWIFTRFKSKILPPVPTPVILNLKPCRPGSQMTERKEEMDELMLPQLHSEDKSGPGDPQETTTLGRDCNTDKDEDRSESRLPAGPSDDSSTDPAVRRVTEAEVNDPEQLDNEIAMLIYRNGLVVGMKLELP